jgi:hypothetical protein
MSAVEIMGLAALQERLAAAGAQGADRGDAPK